MARTGSEKGSLFDFALSDLSVAVSVLVLRGKIPSRESSCGRPATVWESDVSVYRNLYFWFAMYNAEGKVAVDVACPCCGPMGKESVSSAVEQFQREGMLEVVDVGSWRSRGGHGHGFGRWPGTAEVTERLRCAGCRA